MLPLHLQGLLLVDKPAGWTSFDVVNYVRRLVAVHENKKPKNCKVGHTGTLDPLATGLLILLVGKEYTRRAGELSKLDKCYDVTMRLGQTSSTADEEGEKTFVSDSQPPLSAVEAALRRLTGDLLQTPPTYSAMKINGQRAYKLAREGKSVQMTPRPAKIYDNQLTRYVYPDVGFTSTVGSGTYIRSLVEDLGRELGTGAYLSSLRRTSIADFLLADAHPVTDDRLLDFLTNLQ